MDLKGIKSLADLSRLDMTDEEMESIAHDFDSILKYVGQIQEVSGSLDDNKTTNDLIPHNIFREDVVSNQKGSYTDDLVNQFPESENNYLKVKQIL